MKPMITGFALLVLATAAVADPHNPPPANALAGYDSYELTPLAMGPPYAGDEGKEKARARIQEFMTTETGAIVEQWNKDAAGVARGQKLVIEPRIEKLKVVSGAWTVGAQDKDVLHRVVLLMNHYLQANYNEAGGGPTGYDPQ